MKVVGEIETSEKAGQLLPCPFCGGEASRRHTDDHSRGQAKLHIECDVCNARSDWQFTRAKLCVEDWWNQRHKQESVIPPSIEDAKQWKSEQSGFFVSPELDDYVAKLMSDYAMEVLARSGYFDGRDCKGE